MWGLDFGNVHVIVAIVNIIIYMLKWVEAAGVSSMSVGPVIKFLERKFLWHGFPERIVIDRGPAFG